MSPTSQSTDTQHAQRPSIIRTRSQQQHPLSHVDLSASPLKEAIRTHNHNHKTLSSHHTRFNEHRGESVESRARRSSNDDEDRESLSPPSCKKRASSPSFAANNNVGKRVRVFGQSTKANSASRRHSEDTPRKEPISSPANTALPFKRAASSGSASKEIVHLDLSKALQSPSKCPGSPSKTLNITIDGGRTMEVPVTPGAKTSNGGGKTELPMPGALPKVPSSSSEFGVHVDGLSPISKPQPPLQGSLLTDIAHSHSNSITCMPPSVSFQSQSTPIRPRHLGHDLLFESPRTPLPATSHPNGGARSGRPAFPQGSSDGGIRPTGSLLIPTSTTSLEAVKTGQFSPARSRIPVPTATVVSRLPQPSSSHSSGIATTGPTSPTKSPGQLPRKSRPKVNRKPKTEVRSRAPLTRLAAKRGIRRTSSLGFGLRVNTSADTDTVLPLSSGAGSANSSNITGIASGADKKKPLVTSSRASIENAANPKPTAVLPNSTSTSASPTKPTPLSALSTALQKLLATPPTAPTHRSRLDTSIGFAGPTGPSPVVAHPAVSEPAQSLKSDAGVDLQTSRETPPDVSVRHPQTSLAHPRPSSTPNALGRMGLPVRRPRSTVDGGGPSLESDTLFVSKRTNLSTVPASPARSVAPSERGISTSSQKEQKDALDVDAWASPAPTDGGEQQAKEMAVNLVEYSVPLADEPRTTRQPPAGLVSPSRRASQASLSLTQSLSLPRPPSAACLGIARSASTSKAMQYNPRTPVKTRGRTRPAVPEPTVGAGPKQKDPMGGKRSNARMPGSLSVLKDCVIFVDVRTEEGEDAGALFIDMLRGLGARILAKPGKSCTHLIYKDGSPVTITKYKLLPEPRPLPVSIGWVVECAEKREHVDESRFLVNLDELGVAGGAQRRRSMQPKQMRTLTLGQLDSGQPADISVRADTSFTSDEPSTSGPILAALSPPRSLHNLPPLERARQRSLHLSRR